MISNLLIETLIKLNEPPGLLNASKQNGTKSISLVIWTSSIFMATVTYVMRGASPGHLM